MTEQLEMNQISDLIPKLMKAIGGIEKDRTNQHQRYNFRGIDDVLNHVGPPCADLGIRVSVTIHDFTTSVESWEETYKGESKRKFQIRSTLRLKIEFVAPDGSVHVAEAIGDALDTNGDKATNKAMSAAFKYACFMGLVIPVEGALDESDEDDKQPASAKKPAATTTTASTPPPASAAQKPDASAPVYDEKLNQACEKWQDWKTQKGATLLSIVNDTTMDEDKKVAGLEAMKRNIDKLASREHVEMKRHLLERDAAFVQEAIEEFSDVPF